MTKLKIHAIFRKSMQVKQNRFQFLALFSILLLFSLIGVGLAQTQDEDFQYWYDHQILHIFGDGIQNSVDIPVSALANGTYEMVEDVEFYLLNRENNSYSYQLSGALFWDVLNQTQILNENATYIQFIGRDGFGYGSTSFKLPIDIIQNQSDKVYIVTEENGGDPSDGPIEAAVELSAIQGDPVMEEMFDKLKYGEGFVHNSKFSIKELAAIFISSDPISYSDDVNDDGGANSNNLSGFSYLTFSAFSIILIIGLVFLFRKRIIH